MRIVGFLAIAAVVFVGGVVCGVLALGPSQDDFDDDDDDTDVTMPWYGPINRMSNN